MKKRFAIFALLMCLCLVGCGSSEKKPLIVKQGNFVIVDGGSVVNEQGIFKFNNYVFVDKETKVMYMHISNGNNGGTVLLVNADGTPRLYEGELE